MEKVKKMDQLIKFLVVFSILLSHIPIDMVYAEEISQSNNTVESNRQESEQVMNHPLERNNPLVQLIANPPEGGNPQQFVSPTPTGSIPGIMARPNVNWRFVKWEISSSIGVSVNDVYAESSLITVQGAGEAVIQAIYERIPGGIVTVRHVDESGNEIANTVLLNGYQGESYTAEAKNISGWELMTTPQNAAGTFTGVDQTVVFTYKRIPAGEVLSQYHTTSKTSTDSLAVPVSSQVVTDETLGTIVDIKESNFTVYSVATAPSARGEYIARNLATAPANYLTTDENLSGLGSALKEIANHIDKTIPNGTITDPMGEGILLQGAGTFDNSHYQLVGWRKNDQGAWIQAPEIVAAVQVTEANQTISISNIALGENEKLTLTYQVRINTESAEFQGETWVLCNGRTTLTTGSDGEYLDFPIPSIKAPVVELKIMKKWVNVPDAEIPDQIEYQVKRTTTVSAESWQMSDSLTSNKGEGYQGTRTKVPVEGQNVVLPKYNNQGEDFFYTVEEVNVPDDFESAVTNEDGTIIITNTKKETSSTTEPSVTEQA